MNLLKNRKKSIVIIILFIIITIMLAKYFNELLVGNNSIEVYSDLKRRKKSLIKEINRLKNENAKLQKEYFELKSLEPDI